MTHVAVTIIGQTIGVLAPYNPEFVTEAKRYSGKWKAPRWIFPVRNEVAVRELVERIYGKGGKS